MKKIIVASLLIALLSCAVLFAEDEENKTVQFEGTQDTLVDSVLALGGYEFDYAKGMFWDERISKSREYSNKAGGFGFSTAVNFDLSAIPHFLKKGWYCLVDLGFFFPQKVTLLDITYPLDGTETISKLGIKSHVVLTHYFNFGFPIDFYFGAGFAYSQFSVKNKTADVNETYNGTASTMGLALFAEADYKFGSHFAVTLIVNPDITFATRSETALNSNGYIRLEKQTSSGFGVGVSVRAGLKYIV